MYIVKFIADKYYYAKISNDYKNIARYEVKLKWFENNHWYHY